MIKLVSKSLNERKLNPLEIQPYELNYLKLIAQALILRSYKKKYLNLIADLLHTINNLSDDQAETYLDLICQKKRFVILKNYIEILAVLCDMKAASLVSKVNNWQVNDTFQYT